MFSYNTNCIGTFASKISVPVDDSEFYFKNSLALLILLKVLDILKFYEILKFVKFAFSMYECGCSNWSSQTAV